MANTVKDFASPNGPILLLSAKGLTTASIAQANGVKDFSGNGKHGQAYNTVTVIEDSEHGSVFSFDTSTSYLGGINLDINNTTGMTYAYWINSSSFNVTSSWPQDIRHYSASTGSIVLGAMATEFFVDHYNSSGSRVWRYEISKSFALNTWHHFAIVISPALGTSIYHNGVLIGSNASKTLSAAGTSVPLTVKGAGTGRVCKMSDIRIYPRALSAAEVKYLYNGFQPNIIVGQTIPSGAILDLSARGLTTAGIAQANGVVDRSGNGNHGQAYNGVAVVNDDEMGSCFSFDLTNNLRIECPATNVGNNTDSFTVSFAYKRTGKYSQATANQLLFSAANSSNVAKFSVYCNVRTADNNIALALYTNSSSQTNFDISSIGKYTTDWHVYAMTYSYTNEMLYLYVDGSQVLSYSLAPEDNFELNKFLIGYPSQNAYHPVGLMTDIRAYPRALTASEVQQLADTSLKKIRDINMGSNLIKHIYYGSNLIYAKIDNYEAVPSEVTYKIHQLMSTTQRNTIEYAGSNTNYRSITYSNGTVNMGDWSDWINAHFTPVMLKSNGTVDYELNRDNLNYKSDGSTPSDIANTSYDGNAMLQIKKFYISVTSTTEDSHEVFNVSISDTKKDSSYTCYGFVDKDGNEQAFAYYSLFHCYIDANNKLRSKAGITLSSYTTQSSYATMLAAARSNGSGWDLSNYALENALGLVLMMIYKDVNPMFVHQDSSNNYRESSTTPYNTTGALAASGGFPWTTTSTMPKALWLESYWRNAAIPGLASNTWVNGLGSLKNSNNIKGFGIYYKLTPPYTMSDPSLWTYMNNTVPYVYTSNSHQLEDVTVYENLLFPKSDAPDAIGPGTGLATAHYTRYWGGGDVNGLGSSYHSATELRPIKTGLYRAMDKWVAPPHYLSYHAFGSASYQSHLQVGAGRLIYLKNSN